MEPHVADKRGDVLKLCNSSQSASPIVFHCAVTEGLMRHMMMRGLLVQTLISKPIEPISLEDEGVEG